jgi:hypothetical protein
MKWISAVLFSLLLLGCSNSPGYYRSPPDTCDGAPGCAVSAVIDGIIYSEPPPKKCSEMRDEQKEKCNAQVDAIKRSIKKAQEN